jgi:hypothetical protein
MAGLGWAEEQPISSVCSTGCRVVELQAKTYCRNQQRSDSAQLVFRASLGLLAVTHLCSPKPEDFETAPWSLVQRVRRTL